MSLVTVPLPQCQQAELFGALYAYHAARFCITPLQVPADQAVGNGAVRRPAWQLHPGVPGAGSWRVSGTQVPRHPQRRVQGRRADVQQR